MTSADNGADSLREPVLPSDSPSESVTVPWEMIENGRYQPRRIRGSCQGRELG